MEKQIDISEIIRKKEKIKGDLMIIQSRIKKGYALRLQDQESINMILQYSYMLRDEVLIKLRYLVELGMPAHYYVKVELLTADLRLVSRVTCKEILKALRYQWIMNKFMYSEQASWLTLEAICYICIDSWSRGYEELDYKAYAKSLYAYADVIMPKLPYTDMNRLNLELSKAIYYTRIENNIIRGLNVIKKVQGELAKLKPEEQSKIRPFIEKLGHFRTHWERLHGQSNTS